MLNNIEIYISMKNKNMLITTGIFSPDIGGPASYCRLLAQEFSKYFPVSVVSYSSAIRRSEDKTLNFKVIRVWRKTPRFLRHLIYLLRILPVARKTDTIFALNAVSAGVPALMAAKMFKKNFWVRIPGDYAWEVAVNRGKTPLLINDFQNSKKKGWIGTLHKLQSWVCKSARGVIVPSEYLAGIVRGWGVDAEKIKVVYNGVNFQPANISQMQARKQIGITGNLILSVGRLVPWKGFRMLIKIMPQLLEINQFFRLVIVGSGPDHKVLEAMIKNLGLQNKVYLVGKKSQEETATFMAAADLFVLNTGYEGFSHQLLEAMVSNVPVITTAVGGNKEIIRQGENGFMVRYNDEFNLIEAIKTVYNIQELKQQFKEEGVKTTKEFSKERMLEETLKIFNV